MDIRLNLAGTGGESLNFLGDTELEVAFFAPVGTPRVADFPKLWALILIVLSVLAIANESNSVVYFSAISEATLAV